MLNMGLGRRRWSFSPKRQLMQAASCIDEPSELYINVAHDPIMRVEYGDSKHNKLYFEWFIFPLSDSYARVGVRLSFRCASVRLSCQFGPGAG